MTTVMRTEPVLGELLDRDLVRAQLCATLGEVVTVVGARTIVWKPGSRALVAYTVERPSGRSRILGKHFAKPVRGNRLHDVWAALERTDFGAAAGVPRLLGLCRDLNMVLYEHAPGRLLDATIRLRGGEAPMPGVAGWLASLHASDLATDRQFDLGKEVANLGVWANRVAAARPQHAALAERLFGALARTAQHVRLSADAPIHKDFHYRHVVIGPRLVGLDFDEVRFGDPNFDLAHFCVYLRLLGARVGAVEPIVPELERQFLDGYADATGWAPDERFRFFSGYTCLKIAKQLLHGSGVQPFPSGAEQDRQLRLMLEHGCAAVRGTAT
jgi:Phosphotransferase enzyme family